eukprot:GHRR01014993.1.p1 GENE.GHRR01014993.1~~GHRR01014993.1.p1  ORF type:complete len:224 (+),score=76.52 GHRR01014993.1:371-1042(+)
MWLQAVLEESKAGTQVEHLGAMLLSFLQRFGCDFDRSTDAVSVGEGGIVKKGLLGKPGILVVQDPLTGREVAGGSHRYADVEDMFRRLHWRLVDAMTAMNASSSSSSRQQNATARRGHRNNSYEDDSDDYDAGDRSPTYQANMRRRRKSREPASSAADPIELLLDSAQALARFGSPKAWQHTQQQEQQRHQQGGLSAALANMQNDGRARFGGSPAGYGNGRWQ